MVIFQFYGSIDGVQVELRDLNDGSGGGYQVLQVYDDDSVGHAPGHLVDEKFDDLNAAIARFKVLVEQEYQTAEYNVPAA